MSESSDEDEKLLSDSQSDGASTSVDDDDEDGGLDLPAPHQHHHHHTFAPPFYGRPPTPLPPSPSLTSLLRPSRPTTPDASDGDGPEPVPRAAPKVPTYEYYGFALHLFSTLALGVYVLWSYLPAPFLHYFGIYYYPNRWWSLAIPSFLVVTLVYVYVALAAYNIEMLTLPMASVETVVDGAASVAGVEGMRRLKVRSGRGNRGREEWTDWTRVWDEGTDAVMDVPLAGVCEVLYGQRRDTDGSA
jgi:PIG-P protein